MPTAGSAINLSIPRPSLFERPAAEVICSGSPWMLPVTTATSRLWHYDKAEAIRLVAGGLDHAIPVYALFVSSEQLDQDMQRLSQIQVTVGIEVRNPIQEL